jgi:ubiquinone/menaquinone biosynthesis C-methylase UbiE
MNPMYDIARLKKEYEDRKQRFVNKNTYSWFNQANLFTLHQRQRTILTALKSKDIIGISKLKIFEMGCGSGGVLTEILNFGASPRNLFGIDLLADRLVHAKAQLPASHFINSDGQNIPFPSHSFDLVLQFTALSSILDSNLRAQITRDMLRVLKPNGIILWYDFWLNPTNPQTHGIRPAEIRHLFPGCTFEFHKITLAPPLARRLVPVSWGLALFLERLRIFNTHFLVVISPKRESNL